MRRVFPLIAAAVLLAVLAARGDELKLKDGTKISGTIVGFEENSFRVKTSYGFAVVQKDQVASISMTDAAKPAGSAKPSAAAKQPAEDKKAEPAPAKSAAAEKPSPRTEKPEAEASETAAAQPAKKVTVPTVRAGKPNQPPAKSGATDAVPKDAAAKVITATTDASTTRGTALSTPAVASPPKPEAPVPTREDVTGNIYTNITYGFQMYKPPDWQVIEGARTVLPGAITAMGTGDQTTYLLIGQEAAGKSLASDIASTEGRLREIMENFRPLSEKQIIVSGIPAMERRFRGTVDQKEWSGIVVYLPRGGQLYTIFGMTYAESDLVQIQENVIARAIASLRFTQ